MLPSPDKLQGLRILVAEDEALILMEIEDMLKDTFGARSRIGAGCHLGFRSHARRCAVGRGTPSRARYHLPRIGGLDGRARERRPSVRPA
jgi:hypothetical protein